MSARDEGTPLLVGEQVQAYAFLMYAEGIQAAIKAVEEHPHPGDDPVRFYRELLEGLRPDAAETAPDFFELGRTYSGSHGWKFRVDAITTRPDTGERSALGWRFFNGEWTEYAYQEDDFDIIQLAGETDVADGGELR